MTEAFHTDETVARKKRMRRRVWGGAAALVVIGALVLTPPLMNVGRYKKRIVQSMSESLGRPVHLDDVQLHLLPRPGFTLKNLVVSEDPEFGSEPVIRANVVTAQLRLGSLWRRQVEFSKIVFDKDENGVGASLNLVRNPAGRWNLESLLTHASKIDAAPTAQKSAGPTPRFPYIEAKGARVNLKLGDEKMPFSLTDAEFALWLPEPQHWHVRLVAKPLRTDSNVADPGTMRVEGTFERAADLADVPANLTASWHDAPLGEASKLLTGEDAGWRGTLHLDAELKGALGKAALTTHLTLDGLRRADLVPPQLLDVTTDCTATAVVPHAMLQDATCVVDGTGGDAVTLKAASVDVQQPEDAEFQIDTETLPLAWTFQWLRLYSARVPTAASPAGTLAIHVVRSAPRVWSGTTAITLPQPTKDDAKASLVFKGTAGANTGGDAASCPDALTFAPTSVALADDKSVMLDANVSLCGYQLHAVGNGSVDEFAALTASVPPMHDGLAEALTTVGEAKVDVTCSRTWTGTQACSAASAKPVVVKKSGKRRRG